MRVLDSSIWIEIFGGTDIGHQHLSLLQTPEDIVVPTIVQHEVFRWLSRVKGVEEANGAITFTGTCHVSELTTAIAVLAADLSATHKLHTSDAIIYATAQLHEALLLTSDSHFKDLPGVRYFEK